MNTIPNNKIIFLYGAGCECEYFWYTALSRQEPWTKNVQCVIDGNRKSNFHGLPVCELDSINEFDNCFIIVTTNEANYKGIRPLLNKKGLHEFKDYLWSKFIGKKLCLINANCYMNGIKCYFNNNYEFIQKYVFYPIDPIHCRTEIKFSDTVLQEVHIYIHQIISRENEYSYFFSDEYVLPRLSDTCQKICIPNFVAWINAFFPTQVFNTVNRNMQPCFYEDLLLDEAFRKVTHKNIKNMISYIYSYRPPHKQVSALFDSMMNQLKEYDQKWDTKIYDFVQTNYKSQKLFIDIAHPSKCLFLYICDKIADLIGIEPTPNDGRLSQLIYGMGFNSFIYPHVKKELALQYDEESIENYLTFGFSQMVNLSEFIRQYIYLKYNVVLQ